MNQDIQACEISTRISISVSYQPGHASLTAIITSACPLAGFKAIRPCMIDIFVARIAAIFEPGSAATTTTRFSKLIFGATLGAFDRVGGSPHFWG